MCHFVLVFFSPFSIAITSLGEELILVLFVRLFDLCLFGFVGFLFLLGSGKGCGLWLWRSLDFSLSLFLRKSLDRKIYITLKSSRQTFWARFMMITSKMWPLEHQQGFPLIWPGDLVSNIKWPIFKLDLEIIKTNILRNVYDDYLKKCDLWSVHSFLLIWPGDLVFDLMWPSFEHDLEIIKTHFEQDSEWLLQKCDH